MSIPDQQIPKLSDGINRIRYGFLILFILLSIANGGREIVGLAIYHAFSLLLFYWTLSQTRLKKTAVDAPVFFFLFICLYSTLYAIMTRMRGLIHFSTILIHCFNFFVLVTIRDEKFEEKFFTLLVLICVIFSFVISFQEFSGLPKSTFFPNANLLANLLSCGIIVVFSAIAWESQISKSSRLRSNNNSCSILRAEQSVVEKQSSDSANQESVTRNDKINAPGHSLLRRIILWASLLMMIPAHIFLFSRGAFLSLFCGLTFLLISNWKKVILPFCYLIAFGFFLTLALPKTMSALASKTESIPDNTRIIVWKTSLKSFSKKPILGWGIGSYGQIYQLNKFPIESDIGQYEKTTNFAHNEFFEVAVEMGIIGFLSFLWLVLSILREGFASLKKTEEGNWTNFAALGSIIVLLTHSFFDFNLHLPILSLLLIFFSAILIRTKDESKDFWIIPSKFQKIILKPALWIWIFTAFMTILSQSFAKIARVKKEKNESIFYYKIASTLNPFYSEHLKELASLTDGNEQEKFLKRAIRFNPGDDTLYTNLARNYFSQQQYDNSVRTYQNAIAKNPKNPFLYSELADIYLVYNKLDSALTLYKKAVQIEPFYVFAHFRIGEIYTAKGEKSAAFNAFQNALKISKLNLKPDSDYSKRLLECDPALLKKKIANLRK